VKSLGAALRAVGGALSRYRRISRAVAVLALIYSTVLILTGGFDIVLGPVTLRSHESNRFISIALLAILADQVGDARRVAQFTRFLHDIRITVNRILPFLLWASIGLAIIAGGLWLAARVVRAMTAETPFGDMALLEIYTRHAANNDLLVGPYSRFAWHHPGPAMFYLFRPLYFLSGQRHESLRSSALLFNLATLSAMLAILRRRATPGLALAVMAVFGVYLFRVPELLASPWNPHLLVLPLALLVVACAAILDGGAGWWPLGAVAGSFLIQTHLSVAPTVGVVVLVTLVWVLVQRPDPSSARRHWWWGNLGLWMLIAIWILPLADQLSSPTGNLGRIYQSFFEQPAAAPSLRDALAGFLNMLSAPVLPGLVFALGGLVVRNVSVAGVLIATGTLLALPWTAGRLQRRGDRFGSALAVLCLWASLAALWSVSRIQGEIFDQLIFWITVLGVLNLACLASALVPPIGDRIGRGALAVPPLLATVFVWMVIGGAAVGGTVGLFRSHARALGEPTAARVRAETAALTQYLEREGLRRPFVRIAQPTWGDAAGVVLALQKSGRAVSIEPDWVFMFGPLAATGDEDCEVVFADATLRKLLDDEGRFAVVADWPQVSVQVARLAPTPR
jgi:hypothetical protein